MPGLTSSPGGESAREFIDDDFVDACRAGDVIRFVRSPFSTHLEDLENAAAQMGALGCRLAASKLSEDGTTSKQISAAFENASQRLGAAALSIDILRIMQELNFNYTGEKIYIRDGFFDEFEIFKFPDLSKVVFQECYFGQLIMNLGTQSIMSPRLERCQIDEIIGPISSNDIPDNVIDDESDIGSYVQEAKTNADILELNMPLSVRVLLTVLRKLFVQSGRGRKENAFFRGLDPNARAYVADILEVLHTEGFAFPHKIGGPTIWMPNRAKSNEAREILKAPQSSKHRVLVKVRGL